MYFLFPVALIMVAFATLAFQFLTRMRRLRSAEMTARPAISADRFRPMLRLLSDEDMAFVSANPRLSRALRSRRRELFRSYLNCLSRDYAQLLAGVRMAMVRSGVDRPELANALVKNRALFAIAICKVEFRLTMHAAGIGKVDVSALVGAMEALSNQVRTLSAAPMMPASLMASN